MKLQISHFRCDRVMDAEFSRTSCIKEAQLDEVPTLLKLY